MEASPETKRRWNVAIWLGFLVILAGVFSYLPLFVRFPATRDFPWANLALLAAGAALIAVGLLRAFRRPHVYRGKVPGIVLGALGAIFCGLFIFTIFHSMRQLPRSARAPRAGQIAPDFNLLDTDRRPVTLSSLLSSSAGGEKTRAVLLIFYRGHW